jgi:hypothetical protein
VASGASPQVIFEHYRACLAAVRRRQELMTENLDGFPPALQKNLRCARILIPFTLRLDGYLSFNQTSHE